MTSNKDNLASEATAATFQCQLLNAMIDPYPSSPSQPSPELRNAWSALTSSWLMHEPPIIGFDPSIVVHQLRLHITLGVMAFMPDPNPSSEHGRDLAGAILFLRIRSGAEPTAHAFARLAIMLWTLSAYMCLC